MLTISNVFHVVSAIIPLYFATIVAYIPLKWWKVFTPDQCEGINKFVASFAVPLLSFQIISRTNPYEMNMKLVSADILQKALMVIILAIIAYLRSREVISWVITGLSLSTLPNTLILGIPLLRAMYGNDSAEFLSQILVLQCLIWYNLLLLLFEVHAANEPMNMSLPNSEVTGELDSQRRLEAKGENKKDGRSMTIILLTVGRKLSRNPNTYASLTGIIWACIRFGWDVNLPKAIDDSISILADGGLGMSMFSLGLFMASQTRLIACGYETAVLAMAVKFIVGPALMAVPSIALGLRGALLRIAIMQAALPQGIVPFVFAKEYNLHPEILSTGIGLGLLLGVPVGLAYYFLLAL